MATSNVTIRMDEELKRQAEELFNDLGLNMTTAMLAFVKQAVREQRIPFVISRDMPNMETVLAMEEVRALRQSADKKTYSSFAELVEEVTHEI